MSHITTYQQTCYYDSVGSWSDKVKEIWIVFHGYAQLSADFVKKFVVLGEEHYVVAPQAASLFYLEGFHGKVGGSWMTKAYRDHAINDYLNMTDAILADVMKNLNIKSLDEYKLNILGFSQGVSTAFRWAVHQSYPINHLILWAGSVPPEFSKAQAEYYKEKIHKTTLVYGDGDQFYHSQKLSQQYELLDQFDIKYNQHSFNGGHICNRVLLKEMLHLYH